MHAPPKGTPKSNLTCILRGSFTHITYIPHNFYTLTYTHMHTHTYSCLHINTYDHSDGWFVTRGRGQYVGGSMN